MGRYATKFQRKIGSVEELIEELRGGRFLPATYIQGRYHINDGKDLLANPGAGIIIKGA